MSISLSLIELIYFSIKLNRYETIYSIFFFYSNKKLIIYAIIRK